MAKVYVVELAYRKTRQIESVFSTYEKANDYVEKQPFDAYSGPDYRIIEMEVDDDE